MKFNTLLAGLFSAALLFSGCSKDDDKPTPDPAVQQPGNTNPQNSSGMSSKVNNVDWTALAPMASFQSSNLILAGSNILGQAISVSTTSGTVTQAGTYAATGTYIEIVQGSTSGPMWMAPVGGSITITKLDLAAKKVSGTFTFSAQAVPGTGATGTKTITSGVFNELSFQ